MSNEHSHQPQQQNVGVSIGSGEQALAVLLLNEPQLLSIRDLGALSITSKSLLKLTEPHWKKVWEQYVAAGAELKRYSSVRSLVFQSWCGENAILSCFADPKLAASCGYKHAAGCLKSKTCFKCGDMAIEAHPLTLTRLCQSCVTQEDGSDDREEYWIIPKSKAKEAFLLGEADLRALHSASHQTKTFTGADATTTVFLLSDIVNASLTKHGGVHGLQAAILAKKAKAMDKYNKSQSTDKPQKKKPRVTKMSDRPMENLHRLKGVFTTLPIGVIYQDSRGGLKMTHAVECPHCNVCGFASDVEKHIRLVHGRYGEPWGEVQPMLSFSPNGGNALAALSVPDELKQAVTNATKVRGHVEKTREDYFSPPGMKWLSCDTTFGGGCKIVVEMKAHMMTEFDVGEYRILAQLGGSKKLPLELLTIGFGEVDLNHNVYADKKTYLILIEALGLDGTTVTPSQVVATLIMEALPASDVVDTFASKWYLKRDNPCHAIFMNACKLLEDAIARSNMG